MTVLEQALEVRPEPGLETSRPKRRANWHDTAFLGLHYDLHARASDPGLNAKLTAEHLRAQLEKVKPDWVQCDAKGHPGYASYPTQLGNAAPGLAQDALRIWRDVTRDLGIRLGVHYSGVWDTLAIARHPDWARVDEHGERDANSTCRLSGYERDLMVPQLLELVVDYGVDGFWVDGDNWAAKPCWCERCTTEFFRRTGHGAPGAPGEPHWDAWLAFHRDLFEEYVTRYASAVHAANPACTVCSSWMYSVRQPDAVRAPVDYLSGDYDYSWGSVRASSEARVLGAKGLSWDLMAWTFTKPGTMAPEVPGLPYTRKSALHLQQEVSEVLALGGAIMLYDQPRRDGRIVGWQQDLLAEVGAYCRERQAVCFGTQSLSEAAVLHLPDPVYRHNDPLFNNAPLPMEGALHALLETQISTDILTADLALEDGRLEGYRLLVVPDVLTALDSALLARLEGFAARGGVVLLSGEALSVHHAAFVGADAAGDAYGVPNPSSDPFWDAVFLRVDRRAVPVAGPWRSVKAHANTAVWQTRLRGPEIALDDTQEPIVTARRVGLGTVVAAHGALFDNCVRGHYPDLRRWIGALIARANPGFALEVRAPARLEVVHRGRDGAQFVNFINRGAGEALHPTRVIVEELPPVLDVRVRLRCGQPPTTVSLEPRGRALTWHFEDGVLEVAVPRVDIHEILVLRWEDT
jgi:alpha-L-fucosidase